MKATENIECADIQRCIGKILATAGFAVIALENTEGAKKPFCCIDVFPSESERINEFWVEDTYSVTIVYIPKIETNEECLAVQERFKKILQKGLEINERYIETEKIQFSRNGFALNVAMDYKITQKLSNDDIDVPKAEHLDVEIKRK